MSDGYAMKYKEISQYLTIITLYEQQKYMYDNKVHSVEHRIVSILQPWLRSIVRAKAKEPVEFGAKFDLSLDSEGYGRIEKISFHKREYMPDRSDGTLQGVRRSLSGTSAGRSDLPDKGNTEIL